MAIDPRIALGYQPPQLEQPMNLMANAMKLQAMQNENALAQRQAAQLERQQMRQNRLGLLLARGSSPEMLQREGFFEPAAQVLELETTRAGERSAAAAAAAAAQEKEMARRKAMFGVLAVAKDPAKYAAARDIAQGMGFDLTGIPEEFPGADYITALEDSLLTPAERAERASKAETASIQRGQLGVSQRRAALEEREFGLKEREFGLEERKFDAEQRALVNAAKADAKTGVPSAEIAKREAAFPKASGAFTAATSEIDSLVSDLGKLAKAPGLSSILGGVEGRLPSVRGKATDAQVLYDAIMSRGAFRELAAMREASPTGGALGQVTEKELAMLQSAFGALGQIQSEKSFADNVKEVVRKLEAAKKNISDVYNATYSYRQSAGGARKTSSGTSYTVEE